VDEVPIEALREAIRKLHGCDSTFVESVPIIERVHIPTGGDALLKSGWRTVWEGAGCVFDLIGHPKANRAYAWSTEVPGTERRRFVAVLRLPPVDTPSDAVRASIIAEYRGRQ
jgi:hypothetical protein